LPTPVSKPIVLEVGLGGRLDAVNAYEPDVSIVTTIALDHTDWLGAGSRGIGFEKAGIFRAGKPALCADPQPPQSLLDHAAAIGADLRLIGRDFGFERPTAKTNENRLQWRWWCRSGEKLCVKRRAGLSGLRGPTQLYNAAVALAALEALGDKLPVTMQAIRPGADRNRAGRPFPGHPRQAGHRSRCRPQSAGRQGAGRQPLAAWAFSTAPGRGRHAQRQGHRGPAAPEGQGRCLACRRPGRPARHQRRNAGRHHRRATPRWRGRLPPLARGGHAGAKGQAAESDRILAFGSFYTVAGRARSAGGSKP
jgi:dihydrofolate synthase/folylpolyglutamate synthase